MRHKKFSKTKKANPKVETVVCPLCKQENPELGNTHTLIMLCGYGSAHDGSRFESDFVCTACMDGLILALMSKYRIKLDNTSFA